MSFTKEELEMFDYLETLRIEGTTNMYGAGTYLVRDFGIDKYKAREVLSKWMDNYDTLAKERNWR